MEEKKMEQSVQHLKMTQTPIPKLIIKLSIPTTISMLVTNIYNVADTYFVSQLGTSASGAVGIIFGLMSIIQAFGFMLGQGSGSILSRSLGAKNVEKASRIASKAFFTALAAGTVVAVLGLLFLEPLLCLLGSTETILPYAKTYATYILLAAPFMTASFTMNNIIRFEGRATYGMIGLTAGGLLNIFGDWYLMTVWDMGIAGAGISTAVSQAISFSILLFMFLSGKTQSRLSLRSCFACTEQKELFAISRTGFSSLMRQGMSSISSMLLNGQAAMYGDAAVAAMSIANRICFFAFAVGLGIGQGFQPVSAYNYGAKKYSRVKKGYFFTFALEEILLSVMIVMGLLFSKELVEIFRDDPDVVAIAVVTLRARLITLFLLPVSSCTNMLFQSVGKNKEATLLASLRNGLAFIPALLIMSHFWGLRGIELAQAVADIITCLISIPFAVSFIRKISKKKDD